MRILGSGALPLWTKHVRQIPPSPADGHPSTIPELLMPILRTLARPPLAILMLSITLGMSAGCSSAKKPPTTPANSGNSADLAEASDPLFTARVQAISRKNQILTLKFADEKVAKVKVRGTVRNFSEVGVGDAIKAKFDETVEIFPVAPTGKPLWSEIQEIKKAPKGTRPGTAVVKPYEFSSIVTAIDYQARKVTLKGPEGRPIHVTGRPDLGRFNEIKAGDTVVARFIETTSLEIMPVPRADSTLRPSRRR